MRNGRRGKKTGMRLAVSAGLFVVLLLGTLGILNSWRQYQEKMHILSVMAGTESEQGLPAAVSLWKGEKIEEDRWLKGLAIARQYGYEEIRANQYGREFLQETGGILLLSLISFTLYILMIIRVRKQMRREADEELLEVSGILEQFQRRQYKVKDEMLMVEETDVLQKIYGQFESLGEMLEILEERMEAEKEETKSLVTDISHQLKTPVAALKACFEILLQEDLSEIERKEFAERCKKQLTGLENLLQALINISRMETGMIEVKKELADISETMVSAVSRVYLKAQEKQIAIELETEDQSEDIERIFMPHDVRWTCEAFINILENAVKYSPEGTAIKIRIQKLTSFIKIEIEDEGIGIPKEEYHKVFKRFYRSQSQSVQQEDGSGIGLYLTREILTRQNGSIRVISGKSQRRAGKEGGAGTTFILQLPIKE